MPAVNHGSPGNTLSIPEPSSEALCTSYGPMERGIDLALPWLTCSTSFLFAPLLSERNISVVRRRANARCVRERRPQDRASEKKCCGSLLFCRAL